VPRTTVIGIRSIYACMVVVPGHALCTLDDAGLQACIDFV
jgi:hypothetical protein